MKSYNPANNKLLGEMPETDLNQIVTIVNRSRVASKTWGCMPLQTRISYIQKLYDVFKIKK